MKYKSIEERTFFAYVADQNNKEVFSLNGLGQIKLKGKILAEDKELGNQIMENAHYLRDEARNATIYQLHLIRSKNKILRIINRWLNVWDALNATPVSASGRSTSVKNLKNLSSISPKKTVSKKELKKKNVRLLRG